LGSFGHSCDFGCRCERRTDFDEFTGEGGGDRVVCLQCFQLAQAAMEGAFNAIIVPAKETKLGLDLRIVEKFCVRIRGGTELGFHEANPAQFPGGGNQLIEESLLQYASRADFGLVIGVERFEFYAVLEGNEELDGGESVRARVLGGLGFAGFSAGASAELGVRGVC
jgi:hypothetical protein